MIKKHHLQDHIPQQQLRLLYNKVLSTKSRFFKKKIKNNRIKPEDFLYRWPQYFSFLAQHASETGTTHYSHLISSQKAVTNRNQQPGMFYLTAKNSGYSSVSPDTRSHIGKKWSVMTVEKQTVWNCSYPPKIKPQLWASLRLQLKNLLGTQMNE